ncbi:hypothetical protein EVAR_89318_1 [Eumeta japonica]|uniref:Uncharacterized protein n=1 Tax=Eumeta variegata TaxID=151549 RepID=A0A4C1YWB7_EUMVA|nr:hypothetical protein EVAR_89318_1 [Eumeta japonica]
MPQISRLNSSIVCPSPASQPNARLDERCGVRAGRRRHAATSRSAVYTHDEVLPERSDKVMERSEAEVLEKGRIGVTSSA